VLPADVAVRLSEALPDLPVMDAVRQAANLHSAGLTLVSVECSGGWCGICRLLFGHGDPTICVRCGRGLTPVVYHIEPMW